jgi:hypothetical protein
VACIERCLLACDCFCGSYVDCDVIAHFSLLLNDASSLDLKTSADRVVAVRRLLFAHASVHHTNLVNVRAVILSIMPGVQIPKFVLMDDTSSHYQQLMPVLREPSIISTAEQIVSILFDIAQALRCFISKA